MSNPTTVTKLARKLEEMDRSGGWLAKQLRVSRQVVSAWCRRDEVCPKARRAQIALTLGIQASDYFDADGFATRV